MELRTKLLCSLLLLQHYVFLFPVVGVLDSSTDLLLPSNSFRTKPVDSNAPNFHSVSSRYSDSDLLGELEPTDTEWLCSTNGFITETQTWYVLAEDGTSIMCQVIHSAVGQVFHTDLCTIY